MPVIRFQLTPDLRPMANSTDIAIDSMNISNALQAAGVDCEISVDHTTGIVEIRHGASMKNSGTQVRADLTAAKITTLQNFVRSMPQYIKDL